MGNNGNIERLYFLCFFFSQTFYFILIIYFNWRLITLQYCSGFCQTLTWISHRPTCVPHPEPPSHLPPHPIPQGHRSAPALSTLSRALNLDQQAICFIYDNIHISALPSQIIPPSPSPIVQKSVLYICVSFAVLHIGLSLKIPYICINILCWCFSFWLTSLCIMGSSFTHLIRTDSNAFFFIAE